MMISFSLVCLKYCLLGCSFVRCSFAYCSIDLSLYCFLPCESIPTKLKNSWVCLPTSNWWPGGFLWTVSRGRGPGAR